ncbi:MAG: hypothetical protein M3162_00665 [Thermoproteota archaeon]|nr:hypothetical protein [Thermoproteota archaeon]
MISSKIPITFTIVGILAASAILAFSIVPFSKAQQTNMNPMASALNNTNDSGNVTVGKLIYDGRGEVTSQTVIEGPTVQTSFSSNGTITTSTGIENVTEIGTYTTTPRANGILYGEGKGVITGKNNEIVTWTSQEIGTMSPDGKIAFRGSIFFNSLSPVGSLAFLDNMPAVFTFQVDPSKAVVNRVWELR